MKIELIDDDFMVGQVFRPYDRYVQQIHGDGFTKFIEKIAGSANKIVPIDFTDFEELNDHVFNKSMKDEEILAMKFPIFTEDQALLVLYSLLIKPQLGLRYLSYELKQTKKYLMSVKLRSGEVFIIEISWHNGKLSLNASYEKYKRAYWDSGCVHLH